MTLVQIAVACKAEDVGKDRPAKGKKSKYAIPIKGPEDVMALLARQEKRRLGHAR